MIIAFLFGGNEVIAPDSGSESQQNTNIDNNINNADLPSQSEPVKPSEPETPAIQAYPDQVGKFHEFEVSTADGLFKAIIQVKIFQTTQVIDSTTYYYPRLSSFVLPDRVHGAYITPVGISYSNPGTNQANPNISVRFGVYNDVDAKFCYRDR